jgi:excisionase family DNA binding protein
MSTEMSTACEKSDTPWSKSFSTNFFPFWDVVGASLATPFYPYGVWKAPRSDSRKTPELRGKWIVGIRIFGRNEASSELTFFLISSIRKLLMNLLTIDDTMAYLNVSKSTVMRLIATEAFDVIRIGRAVRIRRDVLDRFLDEHTTYAGSNGVAS